MKSPAFQFYAADFLSDEKVALMTNQELGCYIKLICYCWREGSIPSSIDKIAKLCGEDGSAMAQLWQSIGPAFGSPIDSHNRLTHPRLELERKKQELFRIERSESGTKGAKARWNKDLANNGSAMAQPMAKPMALDGSTTSSSSSTSISTTTTNTTTLSSTADLVGEIFAYWQTKREKPRSRLDKKRKAAILDRLREGYTVERIKDAIEGITKSKHHMGDNDRHTVYDDIELICRSGMNVDKFADLHNKHGKTFLSSLPVTLEYENNFKKIVYPDDNHSKSPETKNTQPSSPENIH